MRYAPQERIVRRELAQEVVDAARGLEGPLGVRVEEKGHGAQVARSTLAAEILQLASSRAEDEAKIAARSDLRRLRSRHQALAPQRHPARRARSWPGAQRSSRTSSRLSRNSGMSSTPGRPGAGA